MGHSGKKKIEAIEGTLELTIHTRISFSFKPEFIVTLNRSTAYSVIHSEPGNILAVLGLVKHTHCAVTRACTHSIACDKQLWLPACIYICSNNQQFFFYTLLLIEYINYTKLITFNVYLNNSWKPLICAMLHEMHYYARYSWALCIACVTQLYIRCVDSGSAKLLCRETFV